MKTIPTFLLSALVLAGCTDARLWRPGRLERVPGEPPPEPPKPEEPIRYTVGDVFCTPPSQEVVIPFKLLIILDYSGSMDQSDPQMLRIQAVEDLVASFSDEPFVYFGFLRFGTNPVPLPGLDKDFTNNPQVLQAALTELRRRNTVPEGATNYQAALEWAYEAIQQDRDRPDHIAGTKYGILFVTDGRPNEPEQGNPDQALAANRPKIRDRITGCDGYKADEPLNTLTEFINTYFINTQGPDPLASDLLRDMAEGTGMAPCDPDNWGRGKFTEVDDPGDLVFEVDLPRMRKVYINDGKMVFMNYHVRTAWRGGEVQIVRDSDGDGLPDFMESDVVDPNDPWASSAWDYDTDDDGIGDLVAWALGLMPNQQNVKRPYPRPPTLPSTDEEGLFEDPGVRLPSEHDKDGDGLTNDEESFLGTDPAYADTDGDGLSDFVELRFFMNPLDPQDAATDLDGDGFDSKTEVETGMDPHHVETEAFREKYAYRITKGDEFTIEEGEAIRSCYGFTVENVLFLPRSTSDGGERMNNLFELQFIDNTRLPLGPPEYSHRRETVLVDADADAASGWYLRRTLPEHW